MLNAFRHQRMDHSRRLQTSRCIALSAQRLSASTNGSPRSRSAILSGHSLCSTPFGINEWITGRCWRKARGCRWVLNAFRHQRMDHRVSIAPAIHQDCVLNAFRHQRMDHDSVGGEAAVHLCAQRLSASTNGSPHPDAQETTEGKRAQRLSASTNGSLSRHRQAAQWILVLNAFRHQRMDHTISARG